MSGKRADVSGEGADVNGEGADLSGKVRHAPISRGGRKARGKIRIAAGPVRLEATRSALVVGAAAAAARTMPQAATAAAADVEAHVATVRSAQICVRQSAAAAARARDARGAQQRPRRR